MWVDKDPRDGEFKVVLCFHGKFTPKFGKFCHNITCAECFVSNIMKDNSLSEILNTKPFTIYSGKVLILIDEDLITEEGDQ